MKRIGVVFVILVNVICVENRSLPKLCVNTTEPALEESDKMEYEDDEEDEYYEEYEDNDKNEFRNAATGFTETKNIDIRHENKPLIDRKARACSVVVLSNIQNPKVQTLLRKYRYDAKGALIPSSVKYYIKLPQGSGSSPTLIPVNDKAFSPLGGFVRYYKAVPPIPQTW